MDEKNLGAAVRPSRAALLDGGARTLRFGDVTADIDGKCGPSFPWWLRGVAEREDRGNPDTLVLRPKGRSRN